MLTVIFGESCTGKSTLAEALRGRLGATVRTGKDYRRLAKNEDEARALFVAQLREAVTGAHLIWVVSEQEDLALIPEGAVRVLVTAELALIRERFAARLHGQLPPPVAAMLERRHGCFDAEPHDFHVLSPQTDVEALCAQLCAGVQ